MIPCAESCLHQCDGYCTLEGKTRVTNSTLKTCPFFKQNNKLKTSNSLLNRLNKGQFNSIGDSGTH